MTIGLNRNRFEAGLLQVSNQQLWAELGWDFFLGCSLADCLNPNDTLNDLASIKFFASAMSVNEKKMKYIWSNAQIDPNELDMVADKLIDASLMAAARHRLHPRINAMELLLKLGANPNFSSRGGVTPLMFSTSNNDWEAVNLLCEAGADINAYDHNGSTAIGYLNSDNPKLAEMLISSKSITGKSSYTCGRSLKEHFTIMNCPEVLKLV